MPYLLHQHIEESTARAPHATALLSRGTAVTYGQLSDSVSRFAGALIAVGIRPGERVAIFLPKQYEAVYAIFGSSAAGASFVPVNPVLKPRQLAHVLPHCNARILITSAHRLGTLTEVLPLCSELHTVVLTEAKDVSADVSIEGITIVSYDDFVAQGVGAGVHARISTDLAAILYTSGSTGAAKGVALSHRNLVCGAESVAQYLNNSAEDRLLAALPLSFDAGLSQLTTAFSVGASVVLMDYVLPQDVLRTIADREITGLAGVPPLWQQLANLEWPAEATRLRYITNTGGALPVATTRRLRQLLPDTDIFLMYGLTEAFRSTYLPPQETDRRPDSIGKAIPNAEVLVINDEGQECGADEPGELVHRGALVSMGYWNDPERTAVRFRPCPVQPDGLPIDEACVWSGDRVRRDSDGYLYFMGRRDDMIKTSGYRVSPTEVEEVVLSSGLVSQAAAFGIPDERLGQVIVVALTLAPGTADGAAVISELRACCKRELPSYMQPQVLRVEDAMPLNQNGKIDRRALAERHTRQSEAKAT